MHKSTVILFTESLKYNRMFTKYKNIGNDRKKKHVFWAV